MSARKLTATIAAVTVVLGGMLAFTGVPALGAVGHKLLPLAFGAFTKASAVTVDQANGNVYVTDTGANEVDVFGAEGGSPAGGIVSPIAGVGTPVGAFDFEGYPAGVGIDESGGISNGDLYVADAGDGVVDKFTLNASHEYEYTCQFTGYGSGCVGAGAPPTWQRPTGVAVDSGGNVYIAAVGPEHGTVSEFSSAGGNIRQLVGNVENAIFEPAGVAVASDGTLYINDIGTARIIKLTLGGAESTLDSNNSTAVAIDGHGNVFVDDGSYIAEYNPAGEQVDRFGEGVIGSSKGVAVNDFTEEVYVSERESNDIKVFARITVPDVTTEGSSNVGKTVATVAGSVNSDNPEAEGPASYYVQYGTSPELGSQTVEKSVGEGDEAKAVSEELTGLSPETTYYYRLVAVDKGGSNYGAAESFKTGPAVTLGPCAPKPSPTSAILCGVVKPEGIGTFYRFEYGPSPEYGLYTPFSEEVLGTVQEETVTAEVDELLPGTPYYYRLEGFNELGLSTGQPEEFMTPPARPTVNDQAPFATEVASHEATLHGTINPGKGITEYHFVYGLAADEYTQSGPIAYTPLNYEDDQIAQLISGLEPGHVYHYALVATNETGTSTGPDETFSTLPSVAPTAPIGEASEPTLTSVISPLSVPVAPLLVSAPPFPVVETSVSKGGKNVKKHERAKHRKPTHRKTGARRGRRSRAGRSSRRNETKGRAAR